MKQFLNDHFAVAVVLIVFFALFTAYMVQIHWQTNTGTVDWLEGEMKEVIGALLMGLTGAGVRAVVNGNGTRSTDATPPPPPVIDSPSVPVAPVSAPIPTVKAPDIGPPMPHQ